MSLRRRLGESVDRWKRFTRPRSGDEDRKLPPVEDPPEAKDQKARVESFIAEITETLIPAINANLFEINAKLTGFKHEVESDEFTFEQVDEIGERSLGVVSVAVFLLEQQARMEKFFGEWEFWDDDSAFRPRPDVLKKLNPEASDSEFDLFFYLKATDILEVKEKGGAADRAFEIWFHRDKNAPIHEIVQAIMKCREPQKA